MLTIFFLIVTIIYLLNYGALLAQKKPIDIDFFLTFVACVVIYLLTIFVI